MHCKLGQTFPCILQLMKKWIIGAFVLIAGICESCRKAHEEVEVEETLFTPVSNLDSALIYVSDTVLFWLDSMQMESGLIATSYQSNLISLYDNALAVCAFVSAEEFGRAEHILRFFNARLNSEMRFGAGGYFQFRSSAGPQGNRWLGDNAWLLIAIHNYENATGDYQFSDMREALDSWIRAQQDVDGGVFGGTDITGSVIGKVTEGMIDAFNAVQGFDAFHEGVLAYLEQERWDANDQLLVSWPGSNFYYALDNFSWGYCAFEGFPFRVLDEADRFLCTHDHLPSQQEIQGYCFDEDRDVVWLEGTSQMAIAFLKAGYPERANSILHEVAKACVYESNWNSIKGIPYATNSGTGYGDGLLWNNVDSQPATAACCWFVMACREFDPMRLNYGKGVPASIRFW